MEDRKLGSTDDPYLFFLADEVDHISGFTGAAPTVTISKAGGAFGAPSGAVSEIAHGWYKLAGHATDRNTLGTLAVHVEAAGCDPYDGKLRVVYHDPLRDTLAILGNVGMDYRDDVLTRDGDGLPLTFRRRVFLTGIEAEAATPGATGEGEVFTFEGEVVYATSKWDTMFRKKV